MTLRARIVAHLEAHRGERFTNRQLAQALGAPEPSVRRATLAAYSRFDINEAGRNLQGYSYTALDSTPSADATGVPA